MADEVAVAAMQALLRAPRLADDLVGLLLAATRQGAPDGGPAPIVPRGLHQNPSRVTVARIPRQWAWLQFLPAR